MVLKIFLLSLFLSPLALALEIVNQLEAKTTVEATNVWRQNPCDRPNARRYEVNPRGCSWFWECRDDNDQLLNTPLEGICPDNLHFDVTVPSCTYAENVTSPCYLDEDNSNLIPESCTPGPQKFLPHPYNCQNYFLCWQNLTIPQQCPEGEHFSFFDNGCVSEFLADCRAVDKYCGDKELKRTYKPFDSCEKYHICTECNQRFSLIELECEKGSHQFNENLGHCDLSGNVDCQPPPIDDLPDRFPSQVTYQCPSNLYEHHAHPDPAFCDFYFICSEGRSRLYRCLGGHFDVATNNCVLDEGGIPLCPA